MSRSVAAAARAVLLAGAMFAAGACAGLFNLDKLDRCTTSACDAEAGGADAVAGDGAGSGGDAACVDPLGHATDPCAMTGVCTWGPIYASAPAGESAVMALTSDATHIYWTAQPSSAGGQPGSVLRVPKDGGAAQRLAMDDNPKAIAVDDAHVYWIAGTLADGGTLRVQSVEKTCAPLCQTQTIDELPQSSPPDYLAVLGSEDLFLVGSYDQRYAFDVDAGTWVAGARLPAGPYSVAAVSPTAVYAGNESQPFLYRLPLDGTAEDKLVDLDSGVVGLVADCTSVFAELYSNKFVRVDPADAGVVALQAPTFQFTISAQLLAVDDTFVYFALPNSGVSRVFKRGSTPPVQVARIVGAFGIATDDVATYFGNSTTGAIYRIEK